MRSKPEYLVLWEQRIKEITKSRMPVSEWCKINEISSIVESSQAIRLKTPMQYIINNSIYCW